MGAGLESPGVCEATLSPPAHARHQPTIPPQVAPAGLESLGAWQAHDLEAWAAATDAWHPSLLHSGGDDAAYRWGARGKAVALLRRQSLSRDGSSTFGSLVLVA